MVNRPIYRLQAIRTISVVCGLLSFQALGCQSSTDSSQDSAPPQSNPSMAQDGHSPKASPTPPPEAFGAPFTNDSTVLEVPLTDVLAHSSQYADKTITTTGTVERACSRKGCWMEIADGEAKCRVTFKDYGFFVPTDSAGAKTRLQATVATKTLSAGRVKHLEQEGARFSNKAPDGTAQEVQLVATAVQLTR